MRRFFARFANLFRWRRAERELAAEIEAHLALMQEEFERRGMAPDEARRKARVKLGGVEQAKELHREARSFSWVESLSQDVRFALRMLRKNRGFTAVAVITLALCIGANTAMFSVIHAVLLRPLPYENSDRIYLLIGGALDTENFGSWHDRATSYDRFAALSLGVANFTNRDQTQRLSTVEVSSDFFPLVGIQPELGRPFVSADFESKNGRVALVSDRLWRTSLNSDPQIVGRTLLLDKLPVTVVGVLPANLGPLPYRGIDLLLPLAHRRAKGTEVLGRLKPGVSIEAARVEALALAERLASTEERRQPSLIRLERFKTHLVEDSQTMLLLLAAAVGLVLLIACANIANLQLVRLAGRKREMAVRGTLGASRTRLVRQMLVEGLVLVGIGAGAGVLIARWTMNLLIASIPFYVPRIAESRISGKVLAFALLVSVVSTLLSSLVPAIGASRFDLGPALKQDAGPGAINAGQRRLRRAFVLAEVVLATVMLAGAALLVKTFLILRPASPGFDADGKLTLHMNILYSPPAQQIALLREAIQRVSAVPGVSNVAAVSDLPMSGNSYLPDISIGGRKVAGIGTGEMVHYRASTTNFFRVMRMPVIGGRDFSAGDNELGSRVTIVNQTMAGRLWPHQETLGQKLTVEWAGRPLEFTVIGIAHDARIFATVTSARPEMYVPFWQDPVGRMSMVVSTAYDPERVIPAVRDALHPLGNSVTVSDFETMSHLLYESVGTPRFDAQLFGSLAGLAFLLAVVGIYAVASYSVTQRTHEIGIRVALGANPGEVVRLILSEGLSVALLGVAIGIGVALGLTRLMSSMLFGISATDPVTFAGVTVLLVVVMITACYVPARRAMRVDPMVALRHE
jgi:putative ABC transport system permease protein